MSKPVHVRVAEKIATLFDDEERGYLWVTMNQAQEKQAAAQDQGPAFDQAVFNDSLKLAHEDPAALADIYEKTAAQLPPDVVQAIEKQAAHDVAVLQQQQEEFRKTAFLQGVYQYEGFKAAAAQDQANQGQTKVASRVAKKAPALAAAAGITR